MVWHAPAHKQTNLLQIRKQTTHCASLAHALHVACHVSLLQKLTAQAKYAKVPKVRVPHKDVGCWWTLYDYGYDTIRKWPAKYTHPYPGTPAARVLQRIWNM